MIMNNSSYNYKIGKKSNCKPMGFRPKSFILDINYNVSLRNITELCHVLPINRKYETL